MNARDDAWIQRQTAEFRAVGYCLFPGLLSTEDIKRLRHRACSEGGDDLVVAGAGVLGDMPDVMLPLVTSPSVLDVAESLVGPFLQLDSISVVSMPVSSSLGISWHRDPYGSVPVGGEFQRPLALNLLVYLQDLTEETGPLRVISGSHRMSMTMDREERSRPHASERTINCKSGDAVLLHNNLVHSRSPNLSKAPRVHLSIVYSLTCLRSRFTDGPEAAAIRSMLPPRTPPRLHRLFGDDPRYEERHNSGFMVDDSTAWKRWMTEDSQVGNPGVERTSGRLN